MQYKEKKGKHARIILYFVDILPQ